MSIIWIALAFFAGVVFWHYAGRKMITVVFRRNDDMTSDVLKSLSVTSLRKLGRSIDAEIEKRREELDAAGGAS